ncbi:NUDIX domain-containing protein [Kitasatospora sp. NPDC088134]|uniref:NUDIX domain-containing protein n=1 Tax=Kitasatospora sp. NPDC088134 TaxID=3364071 RepID=UPI00382CAE7F
MIDTLNLEDIARKDTEDGVEGVVVGAVVPKNGSVLLLQRAADDYMGGLWELPSGTVDPEDADLLAALRREVAEETGLTVVKATAYIGHFDYLSSSGRKHRQHNWAVETEGEVVLSEEHSAHQWADPAEQRVTSSSVQEILTTWLAAG